MCYHSAMIKALFFILALSLSQEAAPVTFTAVRVLQMGTELPISYEEAGSLILTLSATKERKSFWIYNDTADDIAFCLSAAESPVGCTDDLIVPSRQVVTANNILVVPAEVRVRDLAGAPLSSGTIYINAW